MNMIVGKRQIILATLVVALTVAVYINYRFSDASDNIVPTEATQESENYGDAQFVDNPVTIDADSYFAQARLDRSKSRDEAVSAMQTMLSGATLTPDQQLGLTNQAAAMAKAIEAEGKIENIIKAKGFEDCMVYYDLESIDVVVKTSGLQENEIIQIRDVILQEANVPVENIAIVEVK